MDFLKSIKNWPFLQEPLWRWAIFVIALAFILASWSVILGALRAAD